jgi:hypothetical protein
LLECAGDRSDNRERAKKLTPTTTNPGIAAEGMMTLNVTPTLSNPPTAA